MKHLFTFLLSALALQASAQTAPSWTSAVNLPISPAFSIAPSFATDAAGNTYVAGTFAQSVTLAPGTVLTSQTTVFNTPTQDGVVAKYSPTGSLLWYRQLSGSSNESFQKVIVDASGKVTLMGLATNETQFGATTFATNTPGSVLVLAQLDTQGQVQYVREVGNATFLLPASLASDAAGNYYLSGSFAVAATFGSTPLTTPFATNSIAFDQFVVKMSAAGEVQWAQQGARVFPASATAAASALSHLVAEPGGNVYFVWTCPSETGGFGSLALPASNGDYDGLVVKFDTQGTPLWAKRLGGTGADLPTYAGLDNNGRLVVPGMSAPAGALANPTSVAATTATTGFVTVLEPTAGALAWSRELQATEAGGYRSVAADAAGNIYLAGHFRGQGSVPGKTLTGAGGLDAVVVSYSTNGTLRWTQQSTGTGDEIPVNIALDGTGRPVVQGILTSNGLFGSTALASSATTTGTGTPFVAYMGNVVMANRAGQASALTLYPNPVAAAGAVQLPALPAGTQLTFIDGQGRVARREAAGATLPVAGLAPGLYVVQATAPSGAQWVSRLTVE
jgi:hypothetical protein